MEHCYRIALWMFCLIGYLQAKPICSENKGTWKGIRFNMEDLSLEALLEQVTCGQNLTFISPRNVEERCYCAALEIFIEGLEKAETNCTGEVQWVHETLNSVRGTLQKNSKCQHPSQCQCKNEAPNEQFPVFVKSMENFVVMLNTGGKQ